MRTHNWTDLDQQSRHQRLSRPQLMKDQVQHEKVAAIIAEVRQGGDQVLREFTARYDGVPLNDLQVSPQEFVDAEAQVDTFDRDCIARAINHVTKFHQAQLPTPLNQETAPGILCQRRAIPIENVGLYIPGGTAPLLSTVIMLAVPARIAGCPSRIVLTPPNRSGSVNPHLLMACKLCGIKQVYKVGGAQAIAAMAFGTATIPKVDKIFGPGNSWVTIAKQLVAQDPAGAALDMPAGPSEAMVVIDESSDPAAAAADLLSQAEHGSDSQVMLVSTSTSKTAAVMDQIEHQLASLPRRDLAATSLQNSHAFNVDCRQDALAIVNSYAPEHLIVLLQGARAFADQVVHAGSIFIGPWTPESVGDYASGTNHVLPTNGYARAYSGLSTLDFMKYISYQELTPAGLRDIGPIVERLAELEGLHAHRAAVTTRLRQLSKGDV